MDNQNAETYLSILLSSLSKKKDILGKLLELTRRQESAINEQILNNDWFYSIIDEKGKLIKEIQELDDGFEQIYLRIKEELSKAPHKYEDKINPMKKLIKEIMDIGVELEALELHNKEKMDMILNRKRNEIRDSRKNNRIVSNYYNNMSKQFNQESYFFDTKK